MMTLKDAVLAALELEPGRCCDDAEDREAIAARLLSVLRNQYDALLVREAFADAPTPGTKLAAMRDLGGKAEAEVLEAAYRLAGGINNGGAR